MFIAHGEGGVNLSDAEQGALALYSQGEHPVGHNIYGTWKTMVAALCCGHGFLDALTIAN